MADFRFVHAADIHLDSPLIGLEEYPDAPAEEIRGATRRALENLVDLCLAENVAFLLIAGDIYDGGWKSAETGRFFATQMLRLAKADPPIPVFAIKGNHDAASAISREMSIPNLVMFDHKKPGTQKLDKWSVAIHGQSYDTPEVTTDLSKNYPLPIPGLLNIGLLHTSATGRDGHASYAPCDVNDLARKGYDYWALGHIHKREVLCSNPPILFAGNLQGRHIKETASEGKGCTIVTVQAGQVVDIDHIPLDVLRWHQLEVDLTGFDEEDSVFERILSELGAVDQTSGGRLLAVRLRLIGSTAYSLEIHRNFAIFRENLVNRVVNRCDRWWIEEIRVKTRLPELERTYESDGSIQGVIEAIQADYSNQRDALYQDEVLPLVNRLRASNPAIFDQIEFEGAESLDDLLPDIEQTILAITREVNPN